MILVFGTICIDRVMKIASLPRVGGYVEVESEVTYLGGEAANTANALNHWGAEVRLYGNPFANTPPFQPLREMLAQRNLKNLSETLDSNIDFPVCDIYVTPDGDRTMFGKGFASMEDTLSLESLPFERGQWFTAEPNMSEASRKAASAAAEAGMHVYLMDFNRSDEQIPVGSFWQSSTDWFGARGDFAGNLKLVQDWSNRYGCHAILTDGANGLIYAGPNSPAQAFPAFPPPKVVDSTGSGDMFRAGMLYGLDQKWPVRECLVFASAAGTLGIGSLGATETVPSVPAITDFVLAHSPVRDRFHS
ncbi:hypothetical protein BH11ARM1_BH11ARM1_09020 [soil metagenome]